MYNKLADEFLSSIIQIDYQNFVENSQMGPATILGSETIFGLRVPDSRDGTTIKIENIEWITGIPRDDIIEMIRDSKNEEELLDMLLKRSIILTSPTVPLFGGVAP
jgi:hypothetical protein